MNEVPRELRKRWHLRRWLVLAAVAYFGAFALILVLESRFVFRPASATQFWVPKPSADVEELTLTSRDGNQIHAWWFPKKGSNQAVLYSHGNGANLSLWGRAMVKWRDNLDASVLIYDFPGYGRSTGTPSEQGCYASAEAAWTWLTQGKGVDRAHIILAGESLGGGPAIELAAHHPYRALVLMKPFTSIPDMASAMFPFFPGRYFARTQFDNAAKIGALTRPLFLYHGERDSLVPFTHGKRLFDLATSPKEMYCDPQGTHDTRLPEDFFKRLSHFLQQMTSAIPFRVLPSCNSACPRVG